MAISAKLIRRQADEIYGMPMTEARAGELADEIGRLNDVIARQAETTLGLFDEPVHFAAVLERLRDR